MSNLTKFSLTIAVFAFLGMGFCALAQEGTTSEETATVKAAEAVELDEDFGAEDLGIAEPNLLPDNPFYFAKNWGRGIQSFFTFNSVKKAELKLRFASERLVEAKKMAEKNAEPEKIVKALENYQKEAEKVRTEVEKGNLKVDNPKVEKFFEKLVDQNLKQQKLLDKMEKELPVETYQKIKEIREAALEKFTDASLKIASPEIFGEKVEENIRDQEGSELKHIKNLEVLIRMEEKVPEAAREAIRKAQANTLKRLKGDLEAIPEAEQLILDKYMEKIGGEETRHLEIIMDLENTELSSDVRQKVEKAKEEVLKRVENKLENFKTDEQKEKYLEHLQTGELKKLRVIKELEENLTPEVTEKITETKNIAQDNFRKKVEAIETPEAKEEFLKRIEALPNIRTFEVLKDVEEIISPEREEMLKEMKERVAEKIKEEVGATKTNEARKQKLESISSGSMEAPNLIKELNLPWSISTELKAIEVEKIQRKIEIIEIPQRLEIMKQRIEMEEIPLPAKSIEMLQEKTDRLIEEIEPARVLEQLRKAEAEINKVEETVTIQETAGAYAGMILKEAKKALEEAQGNYRGENYQEAYKDAVAALRTCAKARETTQRTESMEKVEEGRIEIFEKNFPGIEAPNLMICPLPQEPECKGEIIKEKDARGCIIFRCREISGAGGGGGLETEAVKPLPAEGVVCTADWNPVCGDNGKTYSNACWAKVAGVDIEYKGACKEEKPVMEQAWLPCAREGEKVNRNPLLGSTEQKCCSWLIEVRVSKSYSVCKKGEAMEIAPIQEITPTEPSSGGSSNELKEKSNEEEFSSEIQG